MDSYKDHSPLETLPFASRIAEVGIDLNSSIENFVWASNGLGNHSKKAAKTVYDELSKVRGNLKAIKERLGSL